MFDHYSILCLKELRSRLFLFREYYAKDSLFRNDQRSELLLEALRDLSSTEFSLPNKGYNLDRDWPSRYGKSHYEIVIAYCPIGFHSQETNVTMYQ